MRARRACRPRTGWAPLPADDVIPVQVSDTVTRGTVKPTYPVIQYPHNRDSGGDAIANGFVYRGKLIPALRDKLRLRRHHHRPDLVRRIAPTCSRPTTATRRPSHRSTRWTPTCAGSRKKPIAKRGGKGEALPGMGAHGRPRPRRPAIRGRQRRRALHPDQERRHDPESRRRQSRRRRPRRGERASSGAGQTVTSQPAASLNNPVASTPESIAAGKRAYDANCAACHGNRGARRGQGRHDDLDHRGAEAAGSRRISPTTSGITARATARSSP